MPCTTYSGQSPSGPVSSPWSLGNFFPTGTVSFPLTSDIACEHILSEDGWHSFRSDAVLSHLQDSPRDDTLCREIEFLVKHKFIAATYRQSLPSVLVVRIYIIPYDLPGVQGQLRIRKQPILNRARRSLRLLLSVVEQGVQAWDGSASRGVPLFSTASDSRTLAEIYGELPSPSVSEIPSSKMVNRLLDTSDDLQDLGIRSTLFTYQRRSVATMLQKETMEKDVLDPLYVRVPALNKEAFYLQPGTMEILRERPMVAPSRGGVLCEELGTGKTVMTLTLIMATLHQLSAPEESMIDVRPVLTPLSLRYFPSGEMAAARDRLMRSRRQKSTNIPTLGVPSLPELLLHQMCTQPDETVWEHRMRPDSETDNTLQIFEQHQFRVLFQSNIPFYHHYDTEPTDNERFKRRKGAAGPRTMYLTSATLIVVPSNLISQWDREIHKHCERELRVLILRSRSKLPDAKTLASDYDIILITYSRFTAENLVKDVSKLHSWNICKCDEFPGTRIPNCSCDIPNVSPLLQIRWKRLVIDEGHVSASMSTILTPFTKLLSIEHRWIVTGTPTTNLLGLNFGAKVDSMQELYDDEGDTEFWELFKDPEGSASQSREVTPPPVKQARIWNKYDREDLRKLGNMITHFVGVPQFLADPQLMRTHVTEPLMDPDGPRPAAIEALTQVMSMVMVRHRVEDVEADVVLPPIYKEAVFLDLDPYAVRSYNALQAAIAINAVDSERRDQDYLFHPRNSDMLQELVSNMTQIMFWSVDERLYNADEIMTRPKVHIETAINRNASQEDLELITQAIEHIRLAAEDKTWKNIQDHVEVPYRLYDIPDGVFQRWTRIPGAQSQDDSQGTFAGLMHPDRLVTMRNTISQQPLITPGRMLELGAAIAERDHAKQILFAESTKKMDLRKRKASRLHEDAKKAASPEKLKEMKKELDAALSRLERLEKEDTVPLDASARTLPDVPSTLLSLSPFRRIRIKDSASSKLNYIINEVLRYAQNEKFLIFSDSALTLAHVADALDLLQVKYLRFMSHVPTQVREQFVLTFETSETYRVFLMELKHGARGLNLVSASRVIFCEPVWQPDVESQAIKRAHRIGQTKHISVKTLAIRNTAEENMVSRRTALQDCPDKLPKLIDESGMRHYIANPRFITERPKYLPSVEFPLFNIPAQDPAGLNTDAVTVGMDVGQDTETPPALIPAKRKARALSPLPTEPIEGVIQSDVFVTGAPRPPLPKKKKKGVRFEAS
ncbi:SNF2 family N-terminal domain-containing protein [Armillaria nabsnona]|nr:SNF2 family N-terminal domain-containing protein [Armillaria nabsnona]